MNRAFIFPGQGAQKISMGKDFYNSFSAFKEVIDEVDDALEFKLSNIIFDGPEDKLSQTENTQPALMAVSTGIMNVVLKEKGQKIEDIASSLSGHSLGQYSAMVVGGCFNPGDCAKILKLRGKFMQEAVPSGKGAMAAVLAAPEDLLKTILEESSKIGVCEIANDNSDAQIVISGEIAAIDHAISMFKENRIKAIKLKVSAPFHSSLMNKARDQMSEVINEININNSLVGVIDNVSTQISQDAEFLSKKLLEQIPGTVRWRETMNIISSSSNIVYEIGSGNVLTNLMKRSHPNVICHNIEKVSDLDKLDF